jgi:hypothetical protein
MSWPWAVVICVSIICGAAIIVGVCAVIAVLHLDD